MRMLVYASRYTRVEDLIAYVGGRTIRNGPEQRSDRIEVPLNLEE
jgi:hypothetical protein